MKVRVLDVGISFVNQWEALETLMKFLKEDKNHTVFTPNPEIVMSATKDSELKRILNEGDLVVPDGIGIVWASRYSEKKLSERVAGYDLVQALFNKIKNKKHTVYFLGGKPGIAQEAKRVMERTHKNLKIIGVSDGYFDSKKEQAIIGEIKQLKPDILLVGLGVPRQEKWIDKHKDLPVKISIGVGGSFDGMAGSFRRAPKFFIEHNIEWLYRLAKQPTRIRRQIKLPLFVIKVLLGRRKNSV